jgi:hypothetical protein
MSSQRRTRSIIIAFLAILIIIMIWTRRMSSPQPVSSEPSRASVPSSAGPQLGHATKTALCRVNGALPDPGCTPGDIIPSNTKETLCDPSFRTSTVRDSVTSPTAKRKVYEMYDIPQPQYNRGRNQVCEIDHLVSLELGGADTIANLWPECVPGYAGWEGAGFRDKDRFENYLHRQVCSGALSLSDAQHEIATDWFTYSKESSEPGR